MNAKQWTAMFEMNYAVIRAATQGITQEESLAQPRPAGNCLNWVLGHIVCYRNSILELVQAERVWSEAQGGVYRQGAQPLKSTKDAYSLEELLKDLERSQERLTTGLSGGRNLEANQPEGDSFTDQMTKWYFHETYHVGQLGLLRRLAGKEGAIG